MKYFSIIIFVAILFIALYFSKSLDKKDSSGVKEKKGKKKIEDKIFRSLKDKIKNPSTNEAKKKIKKAVRKEDYLEEDWRVNSAVKRIKNKLERNNKEKKKDSKKEVNFSNLDWGILFTLSFLLVGIVMMLMESIIFLIMFEEGDPEQLVINLLSFLLLYYFLSNRLEKLKKDKGVKEYKKISFIIGGIVIIFPALLLVANFIIATQ